MHNIRLLTLPLLLLSAVALGQSTYPSGMFAELPHRRTSLDESAALMAFPVSSEDSDAERFCRHGLATLFAGGTNEAAQAFRETITRSPECAIAHLGLALTTRYDPSRAKEYAWNAYQHRDAAGPQARALIDAYARYFKADSEPEMELVDAETGKRRAKAGPLTSSGQAVLLQDLASIPMVETSPALAPFLLLEQSLARRPLSANAVATLRAVKPTHPAIRLAMTDKSAFSDVDLWHVAMDCAGVGTTWQTAGAVLARQSDYQSAAMAFTAGRRSHHRRLAVANAMPYEADGYVDACEGLGRSFLALGRNDEAARLGRSLVALPRHPHRRFGTESRGTQLLLDALTRSEQWSEIVGWARGRDHKKLPASVLLAVGRAYVHLNDHSAARNILSQLKQRGASGRRLSDRLELIVDVASGDKDALKQLPAARLEPYEAASLLARYGSAEAALPVAARLDGGDVTALATLADIQWQAGRKTAAIETLKSLRRLSARPDVASGALQRLVPVAEAAGLPADWHQQSDDPRAEVVRAAGPQEWTPPQAPAFSLALGKEDGTLGNNDIEGKPVLLVFYLGFGCLHCVEQLNELAPRYNEFREAGIEIIAVGSDSVNDVRASIQQDIETGTETVPFRILCDPAGDTFKAYSCWDEFDDEALHGTFLIDGRGKIRWRDISEEPFMETDFLFRECQRLLATPSHK